MTLLAMAETITALALMSEENICLFALELIEDRSRDENIFIISFCVYCYLKK